MTPSPDAPLSFLASVHPYDSLPEAELAALASRITRRTVTAGETIYEAGAVLEGLYIIEAGQVDVFDPTGHQISALGPRNSFGERGLMRDGRAATTARAATEGQLLVLAPETFRALTETHTAVRRFFERGAAAAPTRRSDLSTQKVEALMARGPISVAPGATLREAATLMRDRNVSCLCVVEGERLTGILTTGDVTERAVAEGLSGDTPVAQIMTPSPFALSPAALGSDVLHAMLERRIGHLPITEGGRLVGIVTQTDLTRFQAVSSARLIGEIARAPDAAAIAQITANIPSLLAQLVAAGNRHEVVTRLVTDIADAATRRLLRLAEDRLGAPPVPYLWLACGSQGRQEQTGVSDQDNCLFLSDDARPEHDAYFAQLATFVSDGLNTAGYVYCPGEMMATTPRWRQPVRVWRDYFRGWIVRPDPMAQMLASVMYDLRPIGGDKSLYGGLQKETLEASAANSIFIGHMASNALKHTPPLGLLGGFATIRSGEHKSELDLKMNGVVPIADLGRIYALRGKLTEINTRARIVAATQAGVVSSSGGSDLLAAYDLIADLRLTHQADEVRNGKKPDNFMAPSSLSALERSHLRDAFVVVRTMQSALSHSHAVMS
jgi:CBS domain-containing protein